MKQRFSLIVLLVLLVFTTRAQQVDSWRKSDLTDQLRSAGDTLYVFNFWATWCKPCIEELPAFKAVQSELEGKAVRFVFISLDFKSKRADTLLPFVSKNMDWAEVVQLDAGNPNDWIPLVDSSWSGAIPATLFWSPKGRIFIEEGLSDTQIRQTIKTLIP